MTDLEIPDTGAVFTFGKSRFAENKPSHFFIKNDPVIHVACGDEHTAVICKNGRIFAFGSNEWGQLGLGHNNMVHKPSCIKALKPEKAKFIACGRAHTIILTESNNVYACGSNTDGQLGLDNVDMVNIPTKLQAPLLQEHGTIKKLSAGSQHSAALTDSGVVFVWGSNSEGQLGLESNRTNSKLPQLLEFKDKIRDISCGYYHTAILTDTGELYTFGESENGKLGLPQNDGQTYKPTRVATPEPLVSVSCGGRHSVGLTADGVALAFGCNARGALGLGRDVAAVSEPTPLSPELFGGERLMAVSCGDTHTAFVTESYKIYTCGDTRHGKLCQDDQPEDGLFGPQQITRFINYKITHVACGGCHTIICAQKLQDTENNYLPPLQRVPNSIINPETKTEVTLETIPSTTDENIANETKTDDTNTDIYVNGVLNEADAMKVNGLKVMDDVEDQIANLPENISDIIKAQKQQLDAEYDKTINSLKNEGKTMTDGIEENIDELKQELEDKTTELVDKTEDAIKSVTGLKPLKDNLPSDSVDNLLQEIEDDLSSKSGKTFTSDTISVKSNGNKSVLITEEIEEIKDEVKSKLGENDEEDLKTESPLPPTEKKLSRIFGTFKRKKVSSTPTLDSKIVDVDSTERKSSTEIKREEDEITVSKTDKTKTCTIL